MPCTGYKLVYIYMCVCVFVYVYRWERIEAERDEGESERDGSKILVVFANSNGRAGSSCLVNWPKLRKSTDLRKFDTGRPGGYSSVLAVYFRVLKRGCVMCSTPFFFRIIVIPNFQHMVSCFVKIINKPFIIF